MTLRNIVNFVRSENSTVMMPKTVVIILSDVMAEMFQLHQQKGRKTKRSEVRVANADSQGGFVYLGDRVQKFSKLKK